jgi:phage terminase large subunit-like protein
VPRVATRGGSGPRWVTPVTKAEIDAGDGADFAEFTQSYCRVTKDSVGGHAGDVMNLRPWQTDVVGRLLARNPRTGRLKHRQGLIGVARKNGKSALGASLALFELLYGPDGGEVYSIAAEKEQARIVFGTARRMVELDRELSNRFKLTRDAIYDPATGSVYRVLSAEAYSKEGLNPHFVIADEVHAQPTRELWDVMALASGARLEPLMVGITTAGVRSDSSGQDSLCYGMYQYGKRVAAKEIRDPAFFMAWWEPTDPETDHRLKTTWAEANPGLGDLVAEADFASAVMRTPEPEFRTKRCNQWVSTATGWLPHGAWADCVEKRPIEPYADVILGFDGSFSAGNARPPRMTAGASPSWT